MPPRLRSLLALWPLHLAALLFVFVVVAAGGQPSAVHAEADDADTLQPPPVLLSLPYIAVMRESIPPVIVSTPITEAVAGVPYTYTVQATGVPAPAFSLAAGPTGMTIDPASGLIQWTPLAAGLFPITVVAANGISPDAQQTFAVTVAPDNTLLPDRIWDPRLDQRGATLMEASVRPGQGYWRLVEARWLNSAESQGNHHIYADTLGKDGKRQIAVPIHVGWEGGSATVYTEAKMGEPSAANFPMYHIAPTYGASPDSGAPADRVEGMGLGELYAPYYAHHTSYLLIWQWTIAPR